MYYPKISIVTPVYNQVNYIEQTILSVIRQEYPNLEYIIMDGGSTDGTLEIIKKYENQLTYWQSETDSGMYHALNNGFNKSTGSIMCWINSDDILMPDSLFNMACLFEDLPNVSWIQGLNSFIDLKGRVIKTSAPDTFSFLKYLKCDYKWIQQESTFWRRSLWEKAGNHINVNLKLAGDFELWFRFFQYDKLYNTTIPIGAWRKRPNQLSCSQIDKYNHEANQIILGYGPNRVEIEKLKKIKQLEFAIRLLRCLKIIKVNPLINRKNKYFDLNNLEIRYSFKTKKFVV